MRDANVFLSGVLLEFAIGAVLLVVVLFLARRADSQRGKLPAEVFRQTESLEKAGCGIAVHLECGHTVTIVVPAAFPCPQCSHEVAALKKIEGGK